MATSVRRSYLDATVLDQSFLDESHDNLENRLEMIADIETPTGFIRASDRNKYVGSVFYEALLVFPSIRRTIGEWLNPGVEFSAIQLEINNATGRFNSLLPSGTDYGGWIGKSITIKIGLRDVLSTYTTVFKGIVTDIGGFSRGIKSFTLIARDDFDSMNQTFPRTVVTVTNFPNLKDNIIGTVIPIIYGDWTTNVNTQGSVTTIITNSANAGVPAGTTKVSVLISENDLLDFDTSEVYVQRGTAFIKFDSADIVDVPASKRNFNVLQDGTAPIATTLIEGNPYKFADGDLFFVKVKGKLQNLPSGVHDDNIVEQAKDILITFGGVTLGDFDANWVTYRDKAAPVESAISTFKSRIWIQDAVGAITYVLSLLEQVRLEAFVDRNLKIKINSLHLDDFVASPSFTIRNWDVEKDTFKPRIDVQNNFNRAKAVYNFLPNRNGEDNDTSIFRNSVAITQSEKEISKEIVFPNLFEETTVINQLKEILKLASAYLEHIDTNLTWRSLLQDIGNFVKVDVKIGSSQFSEVPMMIREIAYDPQGLRIIVRLWSFQMTPFPGHSPGFAGITGGSTATITEE